MPVSNVALNFGKRAPAIRVGQYLQLVALDLNLTDNLLCSIEQSVVLHESLWLGKSALVERG